MGRLTWRQTDAWLRIKVSAATELNCGVAEMRGHRLRRRSKLDWEENCVPVFADACKGCAGDVLVIQPEI